MLGNQLSRSRGVGSDPRNVCRPVVRMAQVKGHAAVSFGDRMAILGGAGE